MPFYFDMPKARELNEIFSNIFGHSFNETGRRTGFLVDVPSIPDEDSPAWKERRQLAMQWARLFSDSGQHACMVYAYEAVSRSNAEFEYPVHAISLSDEIPNTAAELSLYSGEVLDISNVYSRADFWIALTHYTATSSLKIAAARYGFRAASLPSFTLDMLPAISLDVVDIEKKVGILADRMTFAHTAQIIFDVAGRNYELTLDLRYRMGIASCGRFTSNGQAGTLPSGEAYIVPYEGEKLGIVSNSSGILPVETEGDIALCEVEENRIVCIDGDNRLADSLRQILSVDPARSNVSELGLGILGEYGISPIGNNILDEKLSLHIGLGRSDHLGGVTSIADFRKPENTFRVQFAYHPMLAPQIHVLSGKFISNDGESAFIQNGAYVFD